jgi:hypothetical protein
MSWVGGVSHFNRKIVLKEEAKVQEYQKIQSKEEDEIQTQLDKNTHKQ